MDQPLHISLIQANLAWEDKASNLTMFEQKLRSIERTEIVVLPEMFPTGFSMRASELAESMDGPVVNWMKQMAAEKRIILTGSVIIEEEGQYFNRLIWVLPNGHLGYYDKRHLFGYAGEDKIYSPGHKRLVASVKGWRINLQVCYDLRFPVWARQESKSGAPEYDVLLYVANWPEKRNLAWKTLLQARAIENQAYVIGVNRIGEDGNGFAHSGDSRVIDPQGNIIYDAGNTEAVTTIALDPAFIHETRDRFPFLKDADEFRLLD